MKVSMILYILRTATLQFLIPCLTYASVEAAAEAIQFQSDSILLTVYRHEDGVIKGCRVVKKRSEPHLTGMADVSLNPTLVSEEFVTYVIGFCDESFLTRHIHTRRKREFIFPGTKWCGMGNIASGNDDLGTLIATDKCCRAHDQCNVTIGPKEIKGGLQNDDKFSKVSCLCDIEFRECLKRAEKQGEQDAGKIGAIYFNVLRQRCIVMETPPPDCQKWMSELCLHQIPNTKKEPIFRLVETHLKY